MQKWADYEDAFEIYLLPQFESKEVWEKAKQKWYAVSAIKLWINYAHLCRQHFRKNRRGSKNSAELAKIFSKQRLEIIDLRKDENNSGCAKDSELLEEPQILS